MNIHLLLKEGTDSVTNVGRAGRIRYLKTSRLKDKEVLSALFPGNQDVRTPAPRRSFTGSPLYELNKLQEIGTSSRGWLRPHRDGIYLLAHGLDKDTGVISGQNMTAFTSSLMRVSTAVLSDSLRQMPSKGLSPPQATDTGAFSTEDSNSPWGGKKLHLMCSAFSILTPNILQEFPH